jgi:predicted alpha/beta superfamily hydrolase
MQRKRHAILLAGLMVFLALPPSASAQTTSTTQSPQQPWQPWSFSEDSLRSAHIGRVVRVRLALPAEYAFPEAQADSFPVLVIAGANDAFAFASTITSLRVLNGSQGGAVPPMIIVGLHALDLSPYPHTTPAMDSLRVNVGGADSLTSFLATELVPWIRMSFRARRFTVIAGHSNQGQLALYASTHAPGVFNGVVAISPALWWLDDRVNDRELSLDYSRRIAADRSARVFLGVGAFDPLPIRKSAEVFAEQMRAAGASAQRFQYEVFADDHHQTIRERGFVDGVRWVFSPISLSRNPVYALMGGYERDLDTEALRRAYEQVKTQYADGAPQLGFPTALPEAYLRSMLRLPPIDRRTAPIPIAPLICADFARWYPGRPIPAQCER